jgi:hypothetical protein
VEDRLPILIQKQLDAEIHQRPPLFPWETDVDEYDATEAESGNSKIISFPTSVLEESSD